MSRSNTWIGLLILIASIGSAQAQTKAKLIPKKGLVIETNGLNWGMGSEINFFTADRKHHHYYFTWWEQDELRRGNNNIALILGSQNTAVFGSFEMQQTEQLIETKIDCKWNRADTGLSEITYLRIWEPYFKEAIWKDIKGKRIQVGKAFEGKKIVAETPFGHIEFSSAVPFKLRFVGNPNPGPRDYAQRSQYIEFFEDKINIDSNRSLQRNFTVRVKDATQKNTQRTSIKYLRPLPENLVWNPIATKQPLLPQPEKMDVRPGLYQFALQKADSVNDAEKTLRKLIANRWQLGEQHYPSIEVKSSKELSSQAYRLEVGIDKIQIECGSDTALQYALHTLAQAAEPSEGRIQIPCMKITDQPKTSWRGIHMFTGPTALSLHQRMYERILFPLKMNKAVIQCEQAEWKSFPELHNSISVSLSDLKKEFDLLRQNRVEPIPLIQSLGHMEWFFKPFSTRWLAINPLYPYTLNSDLPEAKESIKKIWDEAIDLLDPAILHVGFDEIGMIGFHLPKEKEVSLFKDQLTFLDQYAKSKSKKLMIWGDMGLAPGEAPDACNGVDAGRAKTIRAAIPPGSYVADWHYINNPDPAIYKKSLQIWKQNQNIPLASPWLWPNNVHGFVKAAIDEKAGVLQTTWADFESSEKNMLLNIEQFGAYILALDYAWSGRKEKPAELPYDPIREWTRRFYDQPKPILAKAGFKLIDSLTFGDITARKNNDVFDKASLVLEKPCSASGLTCKASTNALLPEGSLVAEIELYSNDKLLQKIPIRYGVEVRAISDQRPIYAAIEGQDEQTLWQFWGKSETITGIRVALKHPSIGFKLKLIKLID